MVKFPSIDAILDATLDSPMPKLLPGEESDVVANAHLFDSAEDILNFKIPEEDLLTASFGLQCFVIQHKEGDFFWLTQAYFENIGVKWISSVLLRGNE